MTTSTTPRPARPRKPTQAELAAAGVADPNPPSKETVRVTNDDQFDPEVDFDLGTWKAQKSEASQKPIRFRLDDRRDGEHDETYLVNIPPLSEWPFEAVRMMQGGDLNLMLDAIVMAAGDDVLAEVLDHLTQGEVGAILEHLVRISGVTPGESLASGPSSRSTRRR